MIFIEKRTMIIPYEDFELSEEKVDAVKKRHQRLAIIKYIKEYGEEPSDIGQYYTATTEEFETYRRAYYTLLMQDDTEPTIRALKFTATGDSTLGYHKEGSPLGDNFSYSTDGYNWIDNWDGTSVNINDGECLYVRGNNPEGITSGEMDYIRFVTTGSLSCEGNIMHLLSYEEDLTAIPCNYCFSCLFMDCTSLTTAPELPADVLATGCYYAMFGNCTSLTTAPELPADVLATGCYAVMFAGCSSLTTAPELPATTLSTVCYANMFDSCTSLTIAPELPAATLVEGCYEWIFAGCSNLNLITMLATNIDANECLYNWVNGVAPSGTFRCESGMGDSIPSGSSGIPSGWTVDEKIHPVY